MNAAILNGVPYVVSSDCIWCLAKDCAPVCPVDCFYEDGQQAWIHPDECIDCGACEPECPSQAIRYVTDVEDPDLQENTRRTIGRPHRVPMLPADKPRSPLDEAQHRVRRDGFLAELARAASAAARDDFSRTAEQWFPASPLGEEPRRAGPDTATQRAIFTLLETSYPSRWRDLVDTGRTLLATARRPSEVAPDGASDE